jgi:hypothetical protein
MLPLLPLLSIARGHDSRDHTIPGSLRSRGWAEVRHWERGCTCTNIVFNKKHWNLSSLGNCRGSRFIHLGSRVIRRGSYVEGRGSYVEVESRGSKVEVDGQNVLQLISRNFGHANYCEVGGNLGTINTRSSSWLETRPIKFGSFASNYRNSLWNSEPSLQASSQIANDFGGNLKTKLIVLNLL